VCPDRLWRKDWSENRNLNLLERASRKARRHLAFSWAGTGVQSEVESCVQLVKEGLWCGPVFSPAGKQAWVEQTKSLARKTTRPCSTCLLNRQIGPANYACFEGKVLWELV
jgi:hypothetical protein